MAEKPTNTLATLLCVLSFASLTPPARADVDVESRGELGTETRVFYPTHRLTELPPGVDEPDRGNVAIAARLQVDAELSDPGELDELSARGRLFARLDPYDDARSRVVPEEVFLHTELEPLSLRVGYQMLNWTATEAFHPADIINSRILDGSFENPEKIGEPIATLRVDIPAGNLELYSMPVFTAPVLPSGRSRLSFLGPGVELGEALVLERNGQLTDDRFHPQWGARVQQTWGDVDISVHFVRHIDRTSPFVLFDPDSGTLHPIYQALTQVGLTYQHVLDRTLLKLEGAYRGFERKGPSRRLDAVPERNHVIVAAGIEQGLSSPEGGELALLLEGQAFIPAQDDYSAPLEPLFQHDVLIGLRHAFNDEQSTTLLFTTIVDVEHPEQLVVQLGFGRRLGEEWGLSTGLRLLRIPPEDPFAPVGFEHLHDAHQVYLDLKRYF